MNQQNVTTGIVLGRTDYGEADRILTVLTPDYGKLRLMAKGVRRVKSKLAGGIELFSVSQITFIRGRGEIGTLISTRLVRYYSHIVEDVERTMLGYELIKTLNKATEDETESEYFELLSMAFAALDNPDIPNELVQTWFNAQLLKLAGHSPNLSSDAAGNTLAAESKYDFDFDAMAFAGKPSGQFTADHIKFLRLLFSGNTPQVLANVQGVHKLVDALERLVILMRKQYIR